MSTATITLSEEQEHAVGKATAWLRQALLSRHELGPDQILFRIGGYAGTGKTTILRELVQRTKGLGAVVAYTGKAASVLRRKGVDATTIHSCIYRPVNMGGGKVAFERIEQEDLEAQGVRFFMIDEASMVGRELFADLQSFGLPIIAVGDPGQLEPVGSSDINLMRDCDVVLEQIHRQEGESPIIELARKIRMGEPWARTHERGAVVAQGQSRPVDWGRFDVMLCGYNRTRKRMNALARKHFGRSRLVAEGERIICLRNDSALGVFNGLAGVVEKVDWISEQVPNVAQCSVRWEGRDAVETAELVFDQGDDSFRGGRGTSALVDYGYCITVHKAQGSEWDRVVVLDEQSTFWDAARWRYTAVTRAARSLVLVLP